MKIYRENGEIEREKALKYTKKFPYKMHWIQIEPVLFV